MRDPRVRAALVGLILALPPLMAGMSPRRAPWREAALPVLAVEAVLAAGLVVATRERARLIREQTAVASPLVRATLVRARHVRKAHAGRL
jgi:hypothetical protein